MPKSVHIQNISGATIEPFSIVAIVEVVELNDLAVITVDIPSDVDTEQFLVTYHLQIPDNRYGEAFYPSEIVVIEYDDASTPAVDDEWGPVNDSHKLTSTGSGWKIFSVDSDQKLVHATKITAAGAESDCTCYRLWTIELRGGTAAPTSGSFDLELDVRDDTAETTDTVTVTVNYDDTRTELITTLEAEPEMLDDASDLIVSVNGGPFPLNGYLIENLLSSPRVLDIRAVSGYTLNNGVYPFVQKLLNGA